MRSILTSFGIACFLAATCSPLFAAERPDLVAVVDMLELIEEHPRTARLRAQMIAADKDITRRWKEQAAKLDVLRAQLDATPEDDPRRVELVKRRGALKEKAEADGKEAIREYCRGLEGIYADVQEAVSVVAKRRGIRIVLQKTDDPINAFTREDYILKVALRSVVWHDKAVDLTADVSALIKQRKAKN